MSVTVNNSPIKDYIQPDDHTQLTNGKNKTGTKKRLPVYHKEKKMKE